MMTRVKVCGIRRWQDAELAVQLGASALGFNFFPPSPRFIAAEQARAIIVRLPPFVTAVGVFADETDGEKVSAVAREAGVAAIQLHGPRFPEAQDLLEGFLLIRALAVGTNFRPEMLAALKANAFLLDAWDGTRLGGTGKTFDWNVARRASQYGAIILAGGLTPENVQQAIQVAKPFGVDVASGVESAPGIKDPAKLRVFFKAVAEVDDW